jgi:hypothetical protein
MRLGMSCHDEMNWINGDEVENSMLRCGARVGAYIMGNVDIYRFVRYHFKSIGVGIFG